MTYPVTRFDRVATVQARIGWKALTADEYVEDGYVFLATPNIKSDEIDFQNVNFITRFRYDESPGLKLRPDDVLLVKDGNTLGITNLVRSLRRPATVNGSIAVIRTESMHAPYLRYVLASDLIQGRIQAYRAGMGVPHLFQADIRKFALPEPPLLTQRAIADYLYAETARIDALVAHKQRHRELVKARFLELARHTVTGGMELPDPLDVRQKDLRRADWVPVKLGADLRFGSGTTPTAGDEHYYGPGVPWIVTGNLRDQRVDEVDGSVTVEALAEFTALKVHPAESLVVAMYGATVGRLGITTCPATVNQACCVLHSGNLLKTMFLFYYLLSHRDVLMERSVGAGQPNISQQILRGLRVSCPPPSDQLRIVGELDRGRVDAESLDAALERQIDLLLERRQALITAAVTGQIEIPGVAA